MFVHRGGSSSPLPVAASIKNKGELGKKKMREEENREREERMRKRWEKTSAPYISWLDPQLV